MSKGKVEFRGMMPILPTAIQESGELDIVSQCRLVEYCLKCGAVAIGHLGGASEHYMVPVADRRKLIEITVREVAGRVPVFIGATATTARIAADYAKEAEDLGADMLMVGVPYVNAPNRNELYDYYAAVADAVSIPIMVQETSATLDVDLICRMYDEIEQIQSVKSEGPDFLTKCATLIERTQGKMSLIGGAGGNHMIHLLRMGITAFVTGTEALDIHAAVVNAYLNGDENTAADIFYQRLMPLPLVLHGALP